MSRQIARTFSLFGAAALLVAAAWPVCAADYPITAGQRGTAQRVAQDGVPLSALAPGAPDSYTVKRGDTLWGISKIFLSNPWRWPELWGMNLSQIRNPHLIYPGQVLFLDKNGDRARLRLGEPVGGALGNDTLRPRIRSQGVGDAPIASVPMHLIGPFLNNAVVFDTDALTAAPRIVATQEGRVMLSRGETAYVRGDVSQARLWQLFREPKPLVDPETSAILGYEARHVGVAELVRQGSEVDAQGQPALVPSTFTITSLREEAGVGDRLAPTQAPDYDAFAPHAPAAPLSGHVISVYGDALNAGQNQILALNRGQVDGLERGHVLALWRAGRTVVDKTSADRATLLLPEEKIGMLFVFRVFTRVSYALILQNTEPVAAGARFTQP